VDEVADIGALVCVELDQQIVVARGRIDFRGDLRVRDLGRHIVCLAQLALDLDEEGFHGTTERNSRSVALFASTTVPGSSRLIPRLALLCRRMGTISVRSWPWGPKVGCTATRE